MTREEYFIEARDAFYTLNDLKKYNIPKEVYDNICAQFYALGASYNEQPYLPSNLNEAADDYAVNTASYYYEDEDDEIHSNIDKIRQEIERRKNEFYKKLPRACYPESCNSKEEERAIGIYGELTDLITFINSLPEEKQSEDLEKAANNCIAEFADYVMAENSPEEINLTEKLREIFKAGAEWMAKQIK